MDPIARVAGFSAGAHLANKLDYRFTLGSKQLPRWPGRHLAVALRPDRLALESDEQVIVSAAAGKRSPIDVYWNNSSIKDVASDDADDLLRAPTTSACRHSNAGNDRAAKQRSADRTTRAERGHGWGQLRHAFLKANAELEWFEKYVMNREYVWEKLPGDSNPDKIQLPQR